MIILEIIAAVIFTNIFGVLYDYSYAMKSMSFIRPYQKTIIGVISMLFFRSIILIFANLQMAIFNKIGYLIYVFEIILFNVFVFLIIHSHIHYPESKEFYKLFIFCGFMWILIYSYLATKWSSYFNMPVEQLSEKELRILHNEASISDKISIFFSNLIISCYTWYIYILGLVTTLYVYFVSAIID